MNSVGWLEISSELRRSSTLQNGSGSAATPMDAAEVKRTNKMGAWIITDAWHVLGRIS